MENGVDTETFSRLLSDYECLDFEWEWKMYKKSYKDKVLKKKKKRKMAKNKHRSSKKAPKIKSTVDNRSKPLPQYCFDGKARKGCVSIETNRTMIDVTMYCPETGQVLASRTLKDKQGETKAVVDILRNEGALLPRGIVTGDAGILTPIVTKEIIAAGHGYLLQIKTNAGEAYNEVINMPWDNVKVADKNFSEGHGRREIRFLKRLDEDFVAFTELSKYEQCYTVWKREAWVHHAKEDRYTSYSRYLISDNSIINIENSMIQRYARDHWQQESYHWVKDVVLGEDSSHQKEANGSRFLALIRSQIVRFGKALFGSVKKFRDHFMTSPEEISKKM